MKVLSCLLTSAPELARGFIGVAFQIDEQNAAFESIYLRPTNGPNASGALARGSTWAPRDILPP